MKDERRIVAMYGDCQAQVLYLLATSMPSLTERFSFALVTNHADPGESLPPVPTEVANASVLWEQYNEFADPGDREALRTQLPSECEIVRFPAMLMNAFWPFRTKDKRNVAEAGFPWGRYPLGDRIVEEVAALELAPTDAFAAYMQRSAEQMPDLDALIAFERRVCRERDRCCDVTMADSLFENLQTMYQFWSHGNVSIPVYAELIERLFARSSARLGVPPQIAQGDIDNLIAAYPAQFQIPIHPAVIERLGLRFVDRNTRYRYFGQEWTFEEYVTRYIALDRGWS